MKRVVSVGIASVACLTWSAVAVEAQDALAKVPAYLASYYTMAPAAKELTISDKSGRVLSVLEVPADVAVSVHLVHGEPPPSFEDGQPVRFVGNISIRTRPRNEIVNGSLRPQMMDSSLRLDVSDAVVVLAVKP
jgi:hypothetical protein